MEGVFSEGKEQEMGVPQGVTILICEGLTNLKFGAVPVLVHEGLIHQKAIPMEFIF